MIIMDEEVDEIYAKGVELIKKDTIAYTRGHLKSLCNWILYEDKPVEFYADFVRKLRGEIHTRDFTREEICQTKKL